MSASETTDLRSRSSIMNSNIPKDHYYTPHANKTLYWVDSDSESAFQKNMLDSARRTQLEKYGWHRPGVITYKFNSHGFRCNEFDDSPGIIAIGCSFTAGVGLPAETTWPSLVAIELNLSLWNLGIGGASMDTCFRLLYHWIDQLSAKYVLLLTPPDQRFELHTPEKTQCFHPQTIIHPIQRWWYIMPSNGKLNYQKNLLAIQQLCERHHKQLIVKTAEKDLCCLEPRDRWPPARDLLHVGTDEHQSLAEKFLTDLHRAQ